MYVHNVENAKLRESVQFVHCYNTYNFWIRYL